MRLILLLLVTAIGFVACKSKNEKTITSEGGDSTVALNAGKMDSSAKEMQVKMDELKKLEPLTTDQMKTFFPDRLMGIKRSSINTNSMMGISMGEAEYRENDSTQIKLSVYDVAGKAGSGIYKSQFWGAMNMEGERNDGYTKTIDFNGEKAIEKFDETRKSYELMYMAKDRLMVNVTGVNTTLDLVKQAANRLHFDVK
jgi:hypothetical protein